MSRVIFIEKERAPASVIHRRDSRNNGFPWGKLTKAFAIYCILARVCGSSERPFRLIGASGQGSPAGTLANQQYKKQSEPEYSIFEKCFNNPQGKVFDISCTNDPEGESARMWVRQSIFLPDCVEIYLNADSHSLTDRHRLLRLATEIAGTVRDWHLGKEGLDEMVRLDIADSRETAATTSDADDDVAIDSLPKLPYGFFGRDSQCEQIAEALVSGSLKGAYIEGLAGVGKTALAIRCAELACARGFRSVVFSSSCTWEFTIDGRIHPRPDIVRDTFSGLIDYLAYRLDISEISEGNLPKRRLGLLEQLKSDGKLLVFDNVDSLSADDRHQFFSFVRELPRTCKVIVTARPPENRENLDQLLVVTLKIDGDFAFGLARYLRQKTHFPGNVGDDELRVLCQETNDNPLLIVHFSWLVSEKHEDFSLALEELREAGGRPWEFVLGKLDEHQIGMLALLSLFRSGASKSLLAETSGATPKDFRAGLRSLARCPLVRLSASGSHFTLVPLAAEHIGKRFPGEVRAAGQVLVRRCRAKISAIGENPKRNQELETLWPAIEAALPIILGGDNAGIQSIRRELMRFLLSSGRWDKRIDLARAARKSALRTHPVDDYNAGWCAFQAGDTYAVRDRKKRVLVCSRQAEKHWKNARIGMPEAALNRERGLAQRLWGIGCLITGRADVAVEHFQRALGLFRADHQASLGRSPPIVIEAKEELIRAINHLANAQRRAGNLQGARRHSLEARDAASEFPEGWVSAMLNLAAIDLAQEKFVDAELNAREALRVSRITPVPPKKEFKRGKAAAMSWLAQALIAQDKKEEADLCLFEATEIYSSINTADLDGSYHALMESKWRLEAAP